MVVIARLRNVRGVCGSRAEHAWGQSAPFNTARISDGEPAPRAGSGAENKRV